MNNNFNKEIKNNNKIINKNNCVNNNVYFNERTNKNIYINDINKSICARVENDKGKFNDKLNINKTNNKQVGINEVNPIGRTLRAKNSLSNKTNVVIGNTSKSIPKRITTAIICMWLFVLCTCLALVVGVGYSHSKNNNQQVLPNTTTASGSTFSGGDGTESNPYQIATYADLKTLSTNCNAGEHYADTYFKLTNNITIDNTNSATEWVPIGVDLTSTGTPVNFFSGVFDGVNHAITVNGSITGTLSLSASGNLYFGAIFGYISSGEVKNLSVSFSLGENSMFDLTTSSAGSSSYFQYGGIIGGCESSTINNCSIVGDRIIADLTGGISYFGGVVGKVVDTQISNCTLSADLSLQGRCNGMAGIVYNLDGSITNCTVSSSFSSSCSVGYSGLQNIGGIVGVASDMATIEQCLFSGSSFTHTNSSRVGNVGLIATQASTIKNCKVINAKIDIYMYSVQSYGQRIGVIAGVASSVENCYVDVTMARLYAEGDGEGYSGIIAGQATAIKNCYAKVTITSLTVSSDHYLGVVAGDMISKTGVNGSIINPTINNCILIIDGLLTNSNYIYSLCSVASSVTLTAYNCVVIGSTYGLTNSNSVTTDTTNGLYVLSSDNVNLKKTVTYSGTGANGFTWNTTDGTAWDFEETWGIETEDETYPTLVFNVPVTITINVTTNASMDSTTGIDKFIIYKLDKDNNVVNQFVVTNGSVVTFETVKNQKFTLMINHKLYMVATIDGIDTLRQAYTPTADAIINITITAPSGVNTWVII